MMTTERATDFFYDHAGWSHGPDESPETGRRRCANDLTEAERVARSRGWFVRWERDADADYDDQETEWHDWPHYMATMFDLDGNVLAGLGSVMFRDREDPWSGDPYRRVVEAELALEAMS